MFNPCQSCSPQLLTPIASPQIQKPNLILGPQSIIQFLLQLHEDRRILNPPLASSSLTLWTRWWHRALKQDKEGKERTAKKSPKRIPSPNKTTAFPYPTIHTTICATPTLLTGGSRYIDKAKPDRSWCKPPSKFHLSQLLSNDNHEGEMFSQSTAGECSYLLTKDCLSTLAGYV